MRLDVGDRDFKAYDLVVRRLPEDVVLRKRAQADPGSSGRFVTIRLPAHRAEPGNHIITLEGVTEGAETIYVGEYSFAIVKK